MSGRAAGIVALIPVRSFRTGKTRLAGQLTEAERETLSRWMLGRVLDAARRSAVIDTIAVISPDPAVLAAAEAAGPTAAALAQASETAGLNPALDLGRQWAMERAAAAMLVLFADLPLLSSNDVANLARRDAAVVLAPDRHGHGTNALFLRLGRHVAAQQDAFRFQFGEGSYVRHVDEAERLGLDAVTVITAGTTLDIDTPDDLRQLRERGLVSDEVDGRRPLPGVMEA